MDGLASFKSCPRVGGISDGPPSPQLRPSFKSCPRVGGIKDPETVEYDISLFQVVPPCGGHPLRRVPRDQLRGFKSCPRVGGILASQSSPWCVLMFQVVPPCGGHLALINSLPDIGVFQVVPPCGGHRWATTTPWARSSFKSCPRVGGISGWWHTALWPRCFKSCPRVGGIRFQGSAVRWSAGFKSCPRVGGIPPRCVDAGLLQVSSRAPVWGASAAVVLVDHGFKFQVVPPCGGHPVGISTPRSSCKFQVVPPCGGHPEFLLRGLSLPAVSSRAPVWGASAAPGPLWGTR